MPTTKVSILFAQWRIIGTVRLFVFSLEKPKINAFGSKINKSMLVSYWICGKTNKKEVILENLKSLVKFFHLESNTLMIEEIFNIKQKESLSYLDFFIFLKKLSKEHISKS